MSSPTQKAEKHSAFSGIYRAFLQNESSLKRFIRSFLYKPEDIDEIAQETFLRAYRSTQGREIDSPKAYLFQVARSLAYAELSRKTRKLTDYLEDAVDSEVCETASLDEEMVAQQKVRLYFDAISALPPQCRRVFLMRKIQALPYKEIADNLKISVSAVEKHLSHGTLACKRYMSEREQGFGASPESQNANDAPGGR